MQEHQPGLVVIMTDCCSTRFSLPGKTPPGLPGQGNRRDRSIPCCGACSTSLGASWTSRRHQATRRSATTTRAGIFTRTFDKLVGMESRLRRRPRRVRVLAGVLLQACSRETKACSSPGRSISELAARRSIKRRRSPMPSPWDGWLGCRPACATKPQSRWSTSIAGPADRLAERPHRAARGRPARAARRRAAAMRRSKSVSGGARPPSSSRQDLSVPRHEVTPEPEESPEQRSRTRDLPTQRRDWSESRCRRSQEASFAPC